MEKLYRELAADLQLGRRGWVDAISLVEKSLDIMTATREIADKIRASPYAERDDKLTADAVSRVMEVVQKSVDKLLREMRLCLARGIPPRNCEIDYTLVYEIERAVMELTGRACAYKTRNTVTSALNDIAACIHRLAEKTLSSFEWSREGKCYLAPSASEDAKLLCRMWDRAADEFYREGMYHPSDYRALFGYAVGDRVYLALGSAEGHRAEIDLAEGTVSYYDEDRAVNELVARRLEEEARLKCEVRHWGVKCSGVKRGDREQLAKIALALAEATSADFRLTRGMKSMHSEIIARHFEKLRTRV